MIIKFKRPAAIFCGIILMVFGLLFLLYAVFGMNGDEEIRAKKTIAQHDTSVDPEKPMIALTYDDGPYTPVTGRILESLKAVGGRATFFVVGSRIDGREEITRKITEYGCEIGNHTYGHVVLTKTDNENALRELAKNDEVIFDTVGIKPSVVRPPCGCYNDFIRQNEKRPLVMWTIDTRNLKNRNKDRTVNTVLSSVKDGDIVLMHDLFVPTAEASEILIPELVNRGFQLVTVSELINYRGEINGTVLNNS